MKASPVLIESLESRRLMCATLGEGVSGVAHESPGALAELVQATKTANPGPFGQVVSSTAHDPATFPGC